MPKIEDLEKEKEKIESKISAALRSVDTVNRVAKFRIAGNQNPTNTDDFLGDCKHFVPQPD